MCYLMTNVSQVTHTALVQTVLQTNITPKTSKPTANDKNRAAPGSFLVLKEALVRVVLVTAAGGLVEMDAMDIPMGPTFPILPSARWSEFRMASVTCSQQAHTVTALSPD